MPERKHGPTPKPANKLRNQRVSVYFTQSEWERIAIQLDTTVARKIAAYIREAALAQINTITFAPPINLETWKQLSPALKNLNQIAKKLNSDKSYGEADRKNINELTELVSELWRKLL